MNEADARQELLRLPGIGPYSVKLILSVGLRKMNMFHLDSYVREIMRIFYFKNKQVSDETMTAYANKNWSGCQSLVVDALTTNTELWAAELDIDFKFKSGAKNQ